MQHRSARQPGVWVIVRLVGTDIDQAQRASSPDGVEAGLFASPGIRQDFSPERLVGQEIVIVANLEPRMMRGIESRGMLLAARSLSGIGLLTLVAATGSGPGVKVG